MVLEPLNNEKGLLLKISEGDRNAFEHLFDRYYDLIYSASFRYFKIHELAEDMAQTSFLRIWEKRTRLKTVKRFDHYLFKIARNEMTDYYRKNITRSKHERHIRELSKMEPGNPEELLISKQKTVLIADVIRQLSPQQQMAFRLSREAGLSYQEIADEMNLSVNTIKVHIFHALKSLRTFFARQKNEFLLLLIIFVVGA